MDQGSVDDRASDEPEGGFAQIPVVPSVAEKRRDPRTRMLLEAPITPTLLRLAAPNVLVMVTQASVGLIETYFVGKLGTAALAGVALVFPVVMLMQMMSAGAMGGGISSAIARALGSGRRDDANALTIHALAIGGIFGIAFMVVALGFGRPLYAAMGGSGDALAAALTYSNVVFSGALLVWLFNSLANVIRGTGNMMVPAIVTCTGAAVLVPLSPCLIFGWGPFPQLGIAGGAVAVIAFYGLGSIAFLAYLWTGRSVVRLVLSGGLQRVLFWDILRVGMVAALITVGTNLTIGIATALVGQFGPAAIAGYGTGSRIEYLLIPLVFGLGGPLVAMVGTNIGAGQRDRALRTAWIGAAVAAALCETIGLTAAAFPGAWLSLFDADPGMIEAGTRYLHAVGPGLRPVRARHGALLRVARRRAPAVAARRQHDAPGDRGRRRLARAALDRRFVLRVRGAGAGAHRVRLDHRRSSRERRLVSRAGRTAREVMPSR